MSNKVTTTKYTCITFLPKNLFEQFHRFANLYFLFIVMLNFVPEINAFGKEISMLPVIFVLGVVVPNILFVDEVVEILERNSMRLKWKKFSSMQLKETPSSLSAS